LKTKQKKVRTKVDKLINFCLDLKKTKKNISNHFKTWVRKWM